MRRNESKRLIPFTLLAGLAIVGVKITPAHATSVNYTATTSGNWETTTNWDQFPGSADRALITASNTVTVSLSSTQTIGQLDVGANNTLLIKPGSTFTDSASGLSGLFNLGVSGVGHAYTTQSGGTFNLSNLVMGFNGGNRIGSFAISGGTLGISSSASIGNSGGSGYFDQTGGAATIGGNMTIVNASGNTTSFVTEGRYSIAGGSMTVSGNVVNGGWGTGTGISTARSTVSITGSTGTFKVLGSYSTGAENTSTGTPRHSFVNAQIDSGGLTAIDVTGNVSLAGTLSVSLGSGVTLSDGQVFTLFKVGGTTTGQFIGLGEGALVGNYGGKNLFISYTAGSSSNNVVLYTTTVPEPASFAMLGIGAALLGRRRRRH